MITKSMLLNSIVFNIAWLGCVLMGNTLSYLVLVWAAIHLLYSSSIKSEAVVVLVITFIGSSLDVALMHLGVFQFTGYNYIIPFWLIMIWLAFAMTLNGCLTPLQNSIPLQYVVGAIFPPLSYLAGESLGVVIFGYSSIQTALVLSVIWTGLLPLLFFINQCVKGDFTYENGKIIS